MRESNTVVPAKGEDLVAATIVVTATCRRLRKVTARLGWDCLGAIQFVSTTGSCAANPPD